MTKSIVIAVLADCHIHPAGGIDWPPAALAALAGVDRIVTLGDMGELVGLDALEAIAPVSGVLGQDDEPHEAALALTLVIEEGGLRIGCVFDPVAAGLATSNMPFVPAPDAVEIEEDLFDGALDVLLCASTHRAAISRDGEGLLVVDPGSVTLPDGQEDGARGTFARLFLENGEARAEIVEL
jgi:predicted phosphodiesterase